MSANLTPEEMAATAHENFIKNQIDNKHIIPSLKTQVYAMGAFRDQYGEEKLVIDGYTEPRSDINLTSNNALTYGWEEVEAPDPDELVAIETLPEANSSNAGTTVKVGTTAPYKYYTCMTYGAADLNNLKSTDIVKINIELNETMAAKYPTPNIVIDGREYTSGIAGTDIVLYMNRDHRISILWTADIVETFLVIANR